MSDAKDRLDELLNDPMIQLVMARDNVRPAQIRLLLEQARDRSGEGLVVPPAHVIASKCWENWCRG
jgi:hypothetical protein